MKEAWDKRMRDLKKWRKAEGLEELDSTELANILSSEEDELFVDVTCALREYGRCLVLRGSEHPETMYERARMLYAARRWATVRYEGRKLPVFAETDIAWKLKSKKRSG